MGQGCRQPVAQLGTRPAVERLDQRLSLLVAPEGDPRRLPVRDRPRGRRPLAVVVVQAVHALAQLDEELVARARAPCCPHAVTALWVARWLGLGERVPAGAQIAEGVTAVGPGRGGAADRLAEVV